MATQTRYYDVLILMIQILFFFSMDKVFTNQVKLGTVPVLILTLYVLSMFSSIVFNFNKDVYEWSDSPHYNSAGEPSYYKYIGKHSYYWNDTGYRLYNILNLDAKSNPGVNMVVTGAYSFLHGPPAYARATCITSKFDSIIDGNFYHTQPVIIYTLMPDTMTEKEKKYVSFYSARQVLKCKEGNVYRAFLQ